MSPMFIPQKIAIHHSASARSTTLEQITQWHLARGWSAIGYNTVIDSRGRAFVGRPIPMRGAGVARANTGLINIVVTGDNTKPRHRWKQRQVDGLAAYIDACCAIWPHLDGQVYGHRDLAVAGHATLCPGIDVRWLIRLDWQLDTYWRKAV